MALVVRRRLAIPLSAIAFFTLALTAPPSGTLFLIPLTSVFAMAAIGIGAILFMTPGAIAWLHRSPSLVRIVPAGHRHPASRRIAMAAKTGGRGLDGPNATEADEASRLARMNDDGGWQMTQFPA